MASLISKKEALHLMEDSDKRKEKIIKETSKLITDAALAGETHCDITTLKLTSLELDWLTDRLILEGYAVQNGRTMISWR